MVSTNTTREMRVTLAADRSRPGLLEIRGDDDVRIAGPFPVIGFSDQTIAATHGNPERLPYRSFGDTPTGTYAVAALLSSRGTELGNIRGEAGYLTYGREGVIVLTPLDGNARLAYDSGRGTFWLYGGECNSKGEIRPTNGGLRVPPGVMTVIIAALAKCSGPVRCVIVEDSTVPPQNITVAYRTDDAPNDPPPLRILGGLIGVPLLFSSTDATETTFTVSGTTTMESDSETHEEEGEEEDDTGEDEDEGDEEESETEDDTGEGDTGDGGDTGP